MGFNMLQSVWSSFLENPEYYITGALVIAETVRRLIKTKNPENIIQLLGKMVAALFDAARVPNRAKDKSLEV